MPTEPLGARLCGAGRLEETSSRQSVSGLELGTVASWGKRAQNGLLFEEDGVQGGWAEVAWFARVNEA